MSLSSQLQLLTTGCQRYLLCLWLQLHKCCPEMQGLIPQGALEMPTRETERLPGKHCCNYTLITTVPVPSQPCALLHNHKKVCLLQASGTNLLVGTMSSQAVHTPSADMRAASHISSSPLPGCTCCDSNISNHGSGLPHSTHCCPCLLNCLPSQPTLLCPSSASFQFATEQLRTCHHYGGVATERCGGSQ